MTDIYHGKKEDGYIELYSKIIRVYYRAELNVENVFIFANKTISMYKGSKIGSTVDNECSEDSNLDMY